MKKRSGFTLVELVVVITLIGILSSAAFGMFTDGKRRAYNAKRDSDVRSVVSSARAMKVNEGIYPRNSVEFHDEARNFISEMVSDPNSSHDINRLGTSLVSSSEFEYTYSYYDPPQSYSDERIMASAKFEEDRGGAGEKNIYFGRYMIGTMTGPTAEEMWTQGYLYSTGQTNPGTVLLDVEHE